MALGATSKQIQVPDDIILDDIMARGLDGRHSVGGEREQARKELGLSLGSRLTFPEKLQ